MSKAQEIMAILDEGKESIPDGLYLNLANRLMDLHREQPHPPSPAVAAPAEAPVLAGTRPAWEERYVEQRRFEMELLNNPQYPRWICRKCHTYTANYSRMCATCQEQLANHRRQEQADRINNFRLQQGLEPINAESLANPNMDILDHLVPEGEAVTTKIV